MKVFKIISTPIRYWLALPSWKQIFIALLAGVILGLVASKHMNVVKSVGSLFINAIHLIIAPVIFTAIVTAILSIKKNSSIGQVTAKAILLYFIFMLISASIGCLLAYWIAPGKNFHNTLLMHQAHSVHMAKPSLGGFIENLLPANPIDPFLQNNVLQLILFAILFGSAIRLAGKEAEPVAKFFFSLNKVVYQLTSLVIWFAPYGIFALMAWTIGNFGLAVLMPLLTLVTTIYLGCFILLFGVYSTVLMLFSEIKPTHFYRAIFPALAFAFTSSSSAATLPITMKCSQEKLGLSAEVSKFLLPLGASFNLNGLSVYLSVATVFAANLYGIHLGLSAYLTIVLTITLTAMGAAAVPGSALIVMGAVMSAVGIPLNSIAIIAGVDRLNDMMQTSTNVAGDVCVAIVAGQAALQPFENTAEDINP